MMTTVRTAFFNIEEHYTSPSDSVYQFPVIRNTNNRYLPK